MLQFIFIWCDQAATYPWIHLWYPSILSTYLLIKWSLLLILIADTDKTSNIDNVQNQYWKCLKGLKP